MLVVAVGADPDATAVSEEMTSNQTPDRLSVQSDPLLVPSSVPETEVPRSNVGGTSDGKIPCTARLIRTFFTGPRNVRCCHGRFGARAY